jgi:hypothetical protein
MNKKYLLSIVTVIIIVSVVSAAFIYNNYSANSNQTGTKNNISVVDDEGYK